MFPALFNIYGDNLIEQALEESSGLVVGEERRRIAKWN